jgi:hypothetical protein
MNTPAFVEQAEKRTDDLAFAVAFVRKSTNQTQFCAALQKSSAGYVESSVSFAPICRLCSLKLNQTEVEACTHKSLFVASQLLSPGRRDEFAGPQLAIQSKKVG